MLLEKEELLFAIFTFRTEFSEDLYCRLIKTLFFFWDRVKNTFSYHKKWLLYENYLEVFFWKFNIVVAKCRWLLQTFGNTDLIV